MPSLSDKTLTIFHRLRCDEAPDEVPVISKEKVLKIECNININTNFMLTGIMNVRVNVTLSFFTSVQNVCIIIVP